MDSVKEASFHPRAGREHDRLWYEGIKHPSLRFRRLPASSGFRGLIHGADRRPFPNASPADFDVNASGMTAGSPRLVFDYFGGPQRDRPGRRLLIQPAFPQRCRPMSVKSNLRRFMRRRWGRSLRSWGLGVRAQVPFSVFHLVPRHAHCHETISPPVSISPRIAGLARSNSTLTGRP